MVQKRETSGMTMQFNDILLGQLVETRVGQLVKPQHPNYERSNLF
jgi:hypothetical protein